MYLRRQIKPEKNVNLVTMWGPAPITSDGGGLWPG